MNAAEALQAIERGSRVINAIYVWKWCVETRADRWSEWEPVDHNRAHFDESDADREAAELKAARKANSWREYRVSPVRATYVAAAAYLAAGLPVPTELAGAA